jgi:hypothetical protein
VVDLDNAPILAQADDKVGGGAQQGGVDDLSTPRHTRYFFFSILSLAGRESSKCYPTWLLGPLEVLLKLM